MDTGIRYSKLSSDLVPAVASFQSLQGGLDHLYWYSDLASEGLVGRLLPLGQAKNY